MYKFLSKSKCNTSSKLVCIQSNRACRYRNQIIKNTIRASFQKFQSDKSMCCVLIRNITFRLTLHLNYIFIRNNTKKHDTRDSIRVDNTNVGDHDNTRHKQHVTESLSLFRNIKKYTLTSQGTTY